MRSHWIISGASPEGFPWNGGETVNRDTGTLAEAVIGETQFQTTLVAALGFGSFKKCRSREITGQRCHRFPRR